MRVQRVNHQVEDLTGLGLKLESFYVCGHGKSVTRQVQEIQDGRPRSAQAARFHGSVNKVDGWQSRKFEFFRRLPAFEISTQYEKLSADLDNPDALILNDSAEMAH